MDYFTTYKTRFASLPADRQHRFVKTADPTNSYIIWRPHTEARKRVGDDYLHSVHGAGVVVAVAVGAATDWLLVRKDVTLETLIEVL